MANKNSYVPTWRGEDFGYITNCQYCNRQIFVKRRNKKYCSKSHKTMYNRNKKTVIEKNENSESQNSNIIQTLTLRIRELIKGNETDKVIAKMLQAQRDKFLQEMELTNK